MNTHSYVVMNPFSSEEEVKKLEVSNFSRKIVSDFTSHSAIPRTLFSNFYCRRAREL